MWLDLGKKESCQCGAKSSRLFSSHNYIFDIPIDSILVIAKTTNLIEMSKSFKLKSGKISDDLIALSDLKEKLFLYYKQLINSIRSNCPDSRCSTNVTSKTFFLKNSPVYLMFNLSSDKNITKTSMEILKSFILIPRLFELSSLFEHSQKNKVFYEFVGLLGIKNGNNTFVTLFKQNESNHYRHWVYYEDESILHLTSYYEMISFCLKNSIVPFALTYKAIEDKYSDNDANISFEEMGNLERYATSLDNFCVTNNRFRPPDETLKETQSVTNSLNENDSNQLVSKKFKRHTSMNSSAKGSQPSNQDMQSPEMRYSEIDNQNIEHMPISKPSSEQYSAVVTQNNHATNNSNQHQLGKNHNYSLQQQSSGYSCSNCKSKNRIENMHCLNCGKENERQVNSTTNNSLKTNNYISGINILGQEVPKIKQPLHTDKEKDRLINKITSTNISYDVNQMNPINQLSNNADKRDINASKSNIEIRSIKQNQNHQEEKSIGKGDSFKKPAENPFTSKDKNNDTIGKEDRSKL